MTAQFAPVRCLLVVPELIFDEVYGKGQGKEFMGNCHG
jgi:hypothetical protein